VPFYLGPAGIRVPAVRQAFIVINGRVAPATRVRSLRPWAPWWLMLFAPPLSIYLLFTESLHRLPSRGWWRRGCPTCSRLLS
jgi:hypothetical protein